MEAVITKRDGRCVEFDTQRIFEAVRKAAEYVGVINAHDIAVTVSEQISCYSDQQATVEEIQDAVERCLMESGDTDVAVAFKRFRLVRGLMRDIKPNDKAIAEYIAYSKYIQVGDDDWTGTVQRLLDMHLRKYNYLSSTDQEYIRTAFRAVLELKILPSMRSLQFGGLAIEVNNARMYNCSYSPITRVSFFKDFFFLLLSGCGVGYSVQSRHLASMPSVKAPDKTKVWHKRIPDSIEGWSEALVILIEMYHSDNGTYVEFDYSSIRGEGKPLKTSGGIAPGHIALKLMLEKVRALLDTMVGRRGSAFEYHRICCFVAEAVLAGGIRRSSCIVQFDPWNGEMLHCKTGDWFQRYPELSMANNSAVNPDKYQTDIIIDLAKQYGEPGYVTLDDPFEEGVNPCGEIIMNALISSGTQFKNHKFTEPKFGFGFCNLTEINVSNLMDREEFLKRCRAAAIIGTLQAGYNDIAVENTAGRDALLGVSITGVADAPIWLTPSLLELGSVYVTEVNCVWAELLGINPAKACCTVKPSGTASLLLGGIGSGMHFHHAKCYIRRVTAKENEPSFMAYRKANPSACIQKPNGDWVIEFAMGTEGKTRGQVTALEILGVQQLLYNSWVRPVNDDSRHHNVSCTIDVKPEEWEGLKAHIAVGSDLAPATSFMPFYGDAVFEFAPREAVDTVRSMQRWIDLTESFREPDYSGSSATDLGSACEGPSCQI